MKIKAQLLVELVSEFEDDVENTAETLRFCVEDDLEDLGYQVVSCEVVEGTEEITFDTE